MYKVIIVDDEPCIRNGLINFIDWESIDCKIIGDASDGNTAKNLIITENPDIIIADIKMPGLSGIDLAKYIYENDPSKKIILLTGYSDFDYAKSAIQYDVIDFVLKPSSTESIIAAVKKAKKIISEEQNSKYKIKTLNEKISENLQEMQEKFIIDYINEAVDNNLDIDDKMFELNLDIHTFYIMIFSFNTTCNKKLPSCFMKKFKNMLSTLLEDKSHITVTCETMTLCTLISFDKENNHLSEYLISLCDNLIESTKSFTDCSINIGISNQHKNHFEIPIAYEEAYECSSYRFYDKSSISIYSEYTNNKSQSKVNKAFTTINSIIELIQYGNLEKATLLMHELLNDQRSKQEPISYIKASSLHICSCCSRLLNTYNINLSDIISESKDIYNEIIQCQSISRLSDVLEIILKSTNEALINMSLQSNSVIKKL
ncbi:hypothetical protein SH1V18_21610 [Vallitalea longa]|uniref:Stage 0 sporulation protein A homolog n=1 Tax=Vallitalea longa TaxID=2936439 RepID=A0A9W5YBX9_9FIRM|nr:response regulator [Vallitalea longa]GKX29681.1 hypothetical protein SH1V18_21610 [Vallitalea longa]